jgi:hypothetical protein
VAAGDAGPPGGGLLLLSGQLFEGLNDDDEELMEAGLLVT